MASRFDVFNLEPEESLITIAIYNAAMAKLAFKQHRVLIAVLFAYTEKLNGELH